VSPSLKAHGISGRARLFEVVQKVKAVNAERFRKALRLGVLPKDPETGKYHFVSSSFDAEALAADPSLELSYIIAPPRMKLYEEISTKIFSIYMKYISDEDIHVYSIDECFLDVTGYLDTYRLSAHELAMTMIREVLHTTGITATAGIGTNLYLAKVAMDIVAKHVPADKDGVRIAKLDEIMQRLYEDNISGKISDERFAKLSETYEAEQRQLTARIAELDEFFAKDQEQTINLKTFMQHVRRYTKLDYLDAEVLRTFIKRIIVMDTMPGKKGKGIEVKIEYTIAGEYKTYQD
jgi:hypothetical protein